MSAPGTHPTPSDAPTGPTAVAPSASVGADPKRKPRRELLAASVGSVVEAYDWTIYGVLAPYFAEQLFPGSSPTARLIAAYLGFALGFLVRPLGSVIIGRLTDTRGRRFGLTLTVGLIAAGSLVLAIVPGHAAIGIGAPLIVVAARLVQGLSVGAENPTAAAYVTETAPDRHRYFYSAVSYGGVVLGSALSFIVLSVLLGVFGEAGVEDGAWRLAFVFGALLGLTALWIRRGAAESEVFAEDARERGGVSPWPVLRSHLRQLAVVFGIASGATTVFYFLTVDFPAYAQDAGAASKEEASGALLLGMAALLTGMLGAGRVADRIGALPVLRIGFAGLAFGSVPLLAGMVAGRVPVQLVTVVLLFLLGMPLAVSNVFVGRLFPPAVRAVAVGLPTALAISLFGGTFPALAELLRSADHGDWVPWWPAITCAAALLASWGVREHPLPANPIPE
ncbi:MFS transporter [Streptomyces caelestis]|uniref:MHS family alpha-ketoglutarate permease-like MFS transporter n=1 Tax=Streptomyces caelestis TaxID=36816 RepID=A0A7W9H4R5_9ACTN|nr:MFS transporter [Streptomyces caelestis]MBB5795436.1 MHS family alpha-ketoglutarate permease-like MFS transporter [Streptomyces caelestis]GGW60010.1 MFS transporter [Streptomyces caelestis]